MQVYQTTYWCYGYFILENSDFLVLAHFSLSLGGWESQVAPFCMHSIILYQMSLTNSGTEAHFAFCGQKAAKRLSRGLLGHRLWLEGLVVIIRQEAQLKGHFQSPVGHLSMARTFVHLLGPCLCASPQQGSVIAGYIPSVRLLACTLTYIRQLKLLNKKKQALFAGPLTIRSVWPIVCIICQTSL